MAKKQYFGIKYPFTSDSSDKYFIDLNDSQEDMVKSDLMHLIFTPKRQRIRMPDYGTDLIKYIFEPNDESTWPAVKTEIQSTVKDWIPNITLDDIQIMTSDDWHEIYFKINYSVSDGNLTKTDNVIVQI